MFYFTKDSPKWMDKYTLSCNIWVSCVPHSYQQLWLSAFSFLSNWWVYLIMILTLIFIITSKVYHHLTFIGQSSFFFYEIFFLSCPCFYVVFCLFLIIHWRLICIANIFSQSEIWFWFTELLNFNVVNFSFMLFCLLFLFLKILHYWHHI